MMEGLSAAVISYYALGLLKFLIEGLAQVQPHINPTLATGAATPVVILLGWRFFSRIRTGVIRAHGGTGR